MKGLVVGQRAECARTFTEEDVAEYVRLIHDENPIWIDVSARARAGFDRAPVPSPLIGALFSQLLGTELPGRGTNWMKQRLTFPAPAFVGESLTASVEIVRLRPEKDLVNLRTVCRRADGSIVADGEALVMAREMV